MKLPEEWISDKMQGHSDFLTDLKRKLIGQADENSKFSVVSSRPFKSSWISTTVLIASEAFCVHSPKGDPWTSSIGITREIMGHLSMCRRPSPDLLEQNLLINKIPKWITSRSKFQQDWVRTTHLNLFVCPTAHALKAYSNKSSFSLPFLFLTGSRL